MKLDNITVEELAKALVEIEGRNPDETFLPRGLTGNPMTLWKLYGLDRARLVLERIAARRAVENTLSSPDAST